MTNAHGFRCGAFAAALAFTLAAGCQHADQRPYPPTTVSADAEALPKLNGKQVADVQIAVAHAGEQCGQAEEAEAQYRQALKLDPNRADAWLRLGVLLDREGRFQESAQAYAKALAARPGEPGAYANMGYSLYLQGRWEEAERNLRQAIALRPEYGRAHNNLGLLLARTGRGDEALEEFQKAGCGESDARCNLAFALTLERRLPEARRQYEQALTLSPSSTPAQSGLRRVDALIAKTATTAHGTELAQQHPGDAAPAASPIQNPAVVPAAWIDPRPADGPPAAPAPPVHSVPDPAPAPAAPNGAAPPPPAPAAPNPAAPSAAPAAPDTPAPAPASPDASAPPPAPAAPNEAAPAPSCRRAGRIFARA